MATRIPNQYGDDFNINNNEVGEVLIRTYYRGARAYRPRTI